MCVGILKENGVLGGRDVHVGTRVCMCVLVCV